MRARRLIIIVAAILLGALAVKHFAFPTYTYSYLLTVEVEFEGQVKTGTGVVTVYVHDHGPLKGITNGLGFDISTSGHAPVVSLGRKGVLIAVLKPQPFPGSYLPKPEPAESLPRLAYFGPQYPKTDADWRALFRALPNQRGVRSLNANDYPGLVWIPEPSNPESAQAVAPSELPTLVDPSLLIKSITVEMTRTENNSEIFKDLPWLDAMRKNNALNGISGKSGVYSPNAAQFLGDEL